jgi:mono/diheme cytochrome c family protein
MIARSVFVLLSVTACAVAADLVANPEWSWLTGQVSDKAAGKASETGQVRRAIVPEHTAITEYLGPQTCVACHRAEAEAMHGSVHYQQTGTDAERAQHLRRRRRTRLRRDRVQHVLRYTREFFARDVRSMPCGQRAISVADHD